MIQFEKTGTMYLKQLVGFFVKASGDHRIGPHHVALYVALFQEWCINNCQDPISISPQKLRQLAKIGRTTYHKCLHELQACGFIKYIPSYSHVIGCYVYMVQLS